MYDLAPLSVGACLNVNEKKIKTIKKPRESGAFPLTGPGPPLAQGCQALLRQPKETFGWHGFCFCIMIAPHKMIESFEKVLL